MPNKNKIQEPLLYIHQPKFSVPKAPMQQTYSIKAVKREKELAEKEKQLDDKKITNDGKKKQKTKKLHQELGWVDHIDEEQSFFREVIIEVEPSEGSTAEERIADDSISSALKVESTNEVPFQPKKRGEQAFKRLKSFKEMNVLEKLQYLQEYPKQLTPFPCEFSTAKKTYRGFFLERTEDEIIIQLLNKSTQILKIDDLKEIKGAG